MGERIDRYFEGHQRLRGTYREGHSGEPRAKRALNMEDIKKVVVKNCSPSCCSKPT